MYKGQQNRNMRLEQEESNQLFEHRRKEIENEEIERNRVIILYLLDRLLEEVIKE